MTRNRLSSIAVVLGLVASGLLVSAEAVQAGTPGCASVVSGVAADGRLVRREVKNANVLAEKTTANPLPYPVYGLVWKDTVDVSGGTVDQLDTFSKNGRPRAISVRDGDAATNLAVTKSQTYTTALDPRAVAGSGSYYVYGIGFNNPLVRWTRYRNADGSLSFRSLTHVRGNMSGIKTMSYSYTYELDGVAYDFLYATTKGGRLLQIRVPLNRPSEPKIFVLATAGFAAVDGLSLSFCNNSPNYLSAIAVDSVTGEARHFTLPNLLVPKQSNLVNRGLVGVGSDWHLHAVV